jgi:hypothetical protein
MSTTYNQEVAPTQDQNSRQVTGYLGNPSLGAEFDKFIADHLPKGSTHPFETKAEITERILNNQLNSNEEFDDNVDPTDFPNYGPPGTKIIGNEKVEHENQPGKGAPNPFDGGSNKPLTPGGLAPGVARAEVGTYEDPNSVSKRSKLTEEDETRVGGSPGIYAAELSAMLCDTTLIYVKGTNVRYSDTSGGGDGGVGSCKALGDQLNKISTDQFKKNMFIPTEASRPDTFGDLQNIVRTDTGGIVRSSSGSPVRTATGAQED